MRRVIVHIDFDSFFASVEQQNEPVLRGKPVGVTAANGRNCIIAASREAKRMGIKSPSRVYEAKKICPEIVLVSAHFGVYWEVSKKFIKICSEYSPLVEVFSMDEVFMDVTQSAGLFGGVYPLIDKIKRRLRDEVGEYITVSVGVSHNKMLAKLASGLCKPNARLGLIPQGIASPLCGVGVMEIRVEDVISVYTRAKLTDICGIGHGMERRLNQMGIYTLIQLRLAPLSALVAEFGEVAGKFLKDVGMGIDKSLVVSYTQAPGVKSVGRNYCLPENEYDSRKVLQNVYELCEEVALKLRRLEKKARTVGIFLRGKQSLHGRRTYGEYFDSGKEMFERCIDLIERSSENWMGLPRRFTPRNDAGGYVRQIGVWASTFEDKRNIPGSLFVEEQKWERVRVVVDRLNDRFGDHTVRNGFLLYADKLTTVPNGYMGDRLERRKLASE